MVGQNGGLSLSEGSNVSQAVMENTQHFYSRLGLRESLRVAPAGDFGHLRSVVTCALSGRGTCAP